MRLHYRGCKDNVEAWIKYIKSQVCEYHVNIMWMWCFQGDHCQRQTCLRQQRPCLIIFIRRHLIWSYTTDALLQSPVPDVGPLTIEAPWLWESSGNGKWLSGWRLVFSIILANVSMSSSVSRQARNRSFLNIFLPHSVSVFVWGSGCSKARNSSN